MRHPRVSGDRTRSSRDLGLVEACGREGAPFTIDPVNQLVVYALAFARLPVKLLKCAWFDKKDYFEFFPLQAVRTRKEASFIDSGGTQSNQVLVVGTRCFDMQRTDDSALISFRNSMGSQREFADMLLPF